MQCIWTPIEHLKNVNAIGFQLSLTKKAILNPKQNKKIILQYAENLGEKHVRGRLVWLLDQLQEHFRSSTNQTLENGSAPRRELRETR
jgi:hypothetical protein